MAAAQQDIDQLMRQAQVKLVGASNAGIKGELYDVFTEFFNDSSCWLEDLTVSVIAGETEYALTPTEGQIIRLSGVVDVNLLPQPALMPTVGTLLLRDTPNTAQTFTATVIKNVVLPNTKDQFPIVPEWVLPLYHVGILDGLLGKMMGQPNSSYSNDTHSVYHLRRFRDAIARARVSALRRNTLGAQSWVFPRTFRTHGQRGGVSTSNTGSW